MSLFAVTSTPLSSSMIQPLSGWPDLTPSTTTTPTPSPSSWTTKWIIGALFYSDVHPAPLPADPQRARRFTERLRLVSIRARRGIWLSDAGRRGALDAPRRNSRSARSAGALGDCLGRDNEVGCFLRHCLGRAGMGAFGSHR